MLTIKTPFILTEDDYHAFNHMQDTLNELSEEKDIEFKELGLCGTKYRAKFFRVCEELKDLKKDANEAQEKIPVDELETYAESIRRKKRDGDRRAEAELYAIEGN